MSPFDVTISIVSFNSKNVIAECISSLIETTQGINIEIVVVDNCSEDGSAGLVKSLFPNVRLIENRENVGFGMAHNRSFRLSKGKYFLVLNPDTIIFPNAINKMVEFMDSHPDAGVAGCKIFWDDRKNFMFPDLKIHNLKTSLIHFTPFCRLFPNSLLAKCYWKTAYDMWDTKIPVEVDGVTGGLMMLRREAFKSVGLFDENFFLFFEEHDLLKRIKGKGWKIYYLPDAEIRHYFEESFRNSTIDVGSIYMQSAEYYYRKHYKKAGLWLLKAFINLNPYLEKWLKKRNEYEIMSLGGGPEFSIRWQPVKNAVKYLIEVAYSPNFVDRAGTYMKNTIFTLSSSVLDRLPDRKGFLRILPVYSDGSTGKVIKVVQIME
jgi:GT2 family glycosyltransferase